MLYACLPDVGIGGYYQSYTRLDQLMKGVVDGASKQP